MKHFLKHFLLAAIFEVPICFTLGYEKMFDAVGLASGVYFYRLQAEEFTQTKRLFG